ncbi:MAG: hypothetical protein NC078_05145 [Ruminococcus sp.]|nr:hypothetical protein [Ruminococcus sp.]
MKEVSNTRQLTVTEQVTGRAAVRRSVHGVCREQHAAAREGECHLHIPIN